MIRIVVYGSLKRGHYNHARGLANAKFLGKRVLKGFKLFSFGSYPGALPTGNVSDLVAGEAYEVDEDTFQALDRMEKGAGYTQHILPSGELVWVHPRAAQYGEPVTTQEAGLISWKPRTNANLS